MRKARSLEDLLNQCYLSANKQIECNLLSKNWRWCYLWIAGITIMLKSSTKTYNSLSVILPIIGKFYYDNYAFVNAEGGEESWGLPAICSKSIEQDHWFAFFQH